jgi:hypothetical protein
LALEKLREVVLPPPLYWNEAATRWARIPMFLHLRAVKLW